MAHARCAEDERSESEGRFGEAEPEGCASIRVREVREVLCRCLKPPNTRNTRNFCAPRDHEKSRNVRNGELGRGMRVWAKCKEIFYNLTKILYCYSCQNYNTFVIQLTSCRRENQCKSRKSKVKSDLKSRKSKVCALNSTSEKLQNVTFPK